MISVARAYHGAQHLTAPTGPTAAKKKPPSEVPFQHMVISSHSQGLSCKSLARRLLCVWKPGASLAKIDYLNIDERIPGF